MSCDAMTPLTHAQPEKRYLSVGSGCVVCVRVFMCLFCIMDCNWRPEVWVGLLRLYNWHS